MRTRGHFKEGLEGQPLVTIITVVFNGEKHLDKTISSVINQTYKNIEYIIVDGGSTDGTLDIIRKYENLVDYWVSEKDQGIYDAMNKGIGLASGKYIGLINADDWYSLDAVEVVVQMFSQSRAEVIFGQVFFVDERLQLARILDVPIPKNRRELKINIVHPATFLAASIYKQKKFDIRFRLASDYAFFLDVFDSGATFLRVEKVLSYMRCGGSSSQFHVEEVAIKYKYFSPLDALSKLIGSSATYFRSRFSRLFPTAMIRAIKKKRGWSDVLEIDIQGQPGNLLKS